MMPMMMEMQARRAAMAGAWAVSKDGVFVVRSGQLLKYDEMLNLVKAVDLPKENAMPANVPNLDEPAERQAASPMGMDGGMQRMMARMHGRMPTRIEVTEEAVFVSQGESLLKFDHELELQARAILPPVQTPRCPMCEMMMERMRQNGPDESRGREL